LSAAPRLRLVTSTVGPVSVAQGTNGPAQTLEIYNDSEGTLSPKLSSSASWIGTTVGGQRACSSRPGLCIPIQIALNTASLPAGKATAILSVADNDPNVVDAPQTVTVTVAVGGSVPSTLDYYVAPGTSRDITFTTNSRLDGAAKTNDGGKWLSLSVDGSGSFRFTYPYRVRLQPAASMASGSYSGTLTTSNSTFQPDNKSIAVTMRVTTQPIAQASTDRLQVRLAQSAPPLRSYITLTNLGQGTLTLQTATGSGEPWLATAIAGNIAVVDVDAGTLAPGTYNASVVLASNAANGSITVPVEFTVVAKGAPVINFEGVVDNGTFTAGDTVARGDVMVVLGDQLSFSPLTIGKAPPLDTAVGGASVLVNGKLAPMYYSSYGQLAFQMPYEIGNGTAVVQVQRDGLTSNVVSVPVADRAPRLLLIGVGTYGAIQNQDLSIPMPVGSFPGVNTHPAKAGDVLTIYAIGLGPTKPTVISGQPAPATAPYAPLTSSILVNFGGGPGGTFVEPAYAGLTPTFAGLYQINVQIPPGLPKGALDLIVGFSDSASNAVQIYLQ
jgi:uncharacterized protein (TIGR03437 family)